MTHSLEIVLTLASVFGAAAIAGLAAERIRISPIVGYIAAGVAVGPFTPGFVAHANVTIELAEIGIILLLFGVGLHFHIEDLKAVRGIAIPGAIVQMLATTIVGALIARAYGFDLRASVVYAFAVSIASTVVLLRVFAEGGALHTRAGHIAVGWLLIEDIITVVAFVTLPLAKTGAGGKRLLLEAGVAIAKILGLIALTLVVGQRVIPRLLTYVAKTGSRELFTLTILALALGLAVMSGELLGSVALGAFLAGTVVGQSEFAARAAADALPMRDAFAVLFFVSIGMLVDPALALPNYRLIVATISIILIMKPLVALVTLRALGHPTRAGLPIAFGLAQVGEFSFVLIALGRELEVVPERATQALIAGSIVSIALNPLLFRLAKRLSLGAPPSESGVRP
jgi:CPA2 family monovalent cation:H+ antiporter-2